MKLKFGSWSLTPYLIVIALVGLQACGGGSTPPPAADANPAGYYTGSATVKETDNTTDLPISDIKIMVSGSRIMIMSDSKALLYDGTFTVSGNNLTSTVTIYSDTNKVTGVDGTATLNATITEGSQLTGDFEGTKFGNGSFVATYSTLSNTAADLSNLHETVIAANNSFWKTDTLNLESAAFDIHILSSGGAIGPSSNFSSLDLIDCEPRITTADPYFPSRFSLIPNMSFFDVSINFISCSVNSGNANSAVTGTYTGFAQFIPGTPNLLAFTMTNGTYSIADEMYYIP